MSALVVKVAAEAERVTTKHAKDTKKRPRITGQHLAQVQRGRRGESGKGSAGATSPRPSPPQAEREKLGGAAWAFSYALSSGHGVEHADFTRRGKAKVCSLHKG
jgi:hypothetical protein